ncbi:MAG: SUMF1/EgtB/PvdO family nonheme iron enzyme [Treponema sp.]|nr:SUMF1/EgtB/PvdO family nonheme iron enzyme [Treponema sp.]
MTKCIKCLKLLPDEANFCFNCGFPVGKLEVSRSCMECGNSLSTVDKFCSKCGVPVKVVKSGENTTQASDSPNAKIEKYPRMVRIPGGQFVMGKGSNNSLITLVSFYMSEIPVTQMQYSIVMGKNPSKLLGEDRPVESVNWCEALIYCNLLSQIKGLTPCYTIGDSTNLSQFEASSPVWKRIACNFTANGFRLPTEAEWEFAAREGKTSNQSLYSGSSNINDVAWYGENSAISSHTVSTKKSNSLGLYDMCGNVAEWCWDYYNPNLPTGSQTNPHGPNIGDLHVKRGGSWLDDPQQCTVFYRSGSAPNGKSSSLGFRVCRSEISQTI